MSRRMPVSVLMMEDGRDGEREDARECACEDVREG